MIQLKVYNNTDKDEQYFLDLYETEPIKLTLSIEDITNTDATSTYSKTFKVPGTRANAQFFKNVFDVDSTMYDVTLKKPAEILVDGAEFKTGHVRLQKVFLNTELDRYDYELLFLGETRDISSIIGDKEMCQLVIINYNIFIFCNKHLYSKNSCTFQYSHSFFCNKFCFFCNNFRNSGRCNCFS